MTSNTFRIALCAGETSGDQLGAGLIAALRERFPDAEFAGIGGDRMREAGLDAWFDADELADTRPLRRQVARQPAIGAHAHGAFDRFHRHADEFALLLLIHLELVNPAPAVACSGSLT